MTFLVFVLSFFIAWSHSLSNFEDDTEAGRRRELQRCLAHNKRLHIEAKQTKPKPSDTTTGVSTDATTGKLFVMEKSRYYSGGFVRESTAQIEKKPGCAKWVVVTSINEPSGSIKKFGELYPEWCTVVVGDEKTSPQDEANYRDLSYVHYLSLSDQQQLLYKTLDSTPKNSFSRKRIGYLYAIEHSAEIILDLDDDNYLTSSSLTIEDSYRAHLSGTMNPYKFFLKRRHRQDKFIWPRGMPLDKIDATVYEPIRLDLLQTADIGVIQCLADKDPDVDAIYRLTNSHQLPLFFTDPNFGVYYRNQRFVPWNAQATIVLQRTFWALFLPNTVHGRVADIWRAYISETIYHGIGLSTLFINCGIVQYRNAHNYMKDFNSEEPLYERAGPLVDYLASLLKDIQNDGVTQITSELIFSVWKHMYETRIIEKEDLYSLNDWLNDMETLGVLPFQLEPNQYANKTLAAKTKQKKKCLVLAYGSIRGGKPAALSLDKYLLQPYQCDLALYVGEDERNEQSTIWSMAAYRWITPEYDDWGHVFMDIDPTRSWDRLFSVKGNFFGSVKCDKKHCKRHCRELTGGTAADCTYSSYSSGGILMAFRYFMKQKLISLNLVDEYEYFIFTRTDHLYLCQHPAFDVQGGTNMLVVEGEDFDGYTDRHWVVKSEYAVAWLNITNYIVEDSAKFVAGTKQLVEEDNWSAKWNIERVLKYYIDYVLHVKVKTMDRVMASIREIGVDVTHRSDGAPYPSTKLDIDSYLVKYHRAMDVAVQHCGAKNTEI